MQYATISNVRSVARSLRGKVTESKLKICDGQNRKFESVSHVFTDPLRTASSNMF